MGKYEYIAAHAALPVSTQRVHEAVANALSDCIDVLAADLDGDRTHAALLLAVAAKRLYEAMRDGVGH